VVDVRATATAAASTARSCSLATCTCAAGRVAACAGAVTAWTVAASACWWGVAAELGSVLGGEGQHALARQAGALLDGIDVEDDSCYLIALVEVLGDVFDVIVAQLTDVNEAF